MLAARLCTSVPAAVPARRASSRRSSPRVPAARSRARHAAPPWTSARSPCSSTSTARSGTPRRPRAGVLGARAVLPGRDRRVADRRRARRLRARERGQGVRVHGGRRRGGPREGGNAHRRCAIGSVRAAARGVTSFAARRRVRPPPGGDPKLGISLDKKTRPWMRSRSSPCLAPACRRPSRRCARAQTRGRLARHQRAQDAR